MRAAQGSLNEVRHELVGPGTAAPPARLERFKWRTVLTTVALAIAAYLLIGEISGNVLGTLGHANPGWFALAIVASAVTYLAAAENLAAAPLADARLGRPAVHGVRRVGDAAHRRPRGG